MFEWGLVSWALFYCAATGVSAFSVITLKADVDANPNDDVTLSCQYSADFGEPRVEWKFQDLKGSQTYVIFNGKPTESYSSRATIEGGILKLKKVTTKDNGAYNCAVSGKGQYREVTVKLTVKVAPGVPLCRVPTSVTTGNSALLSCRDNVGSPPPTYKWFKDGILLPVDPKTSPVFKNASYKLNPQNGNLEFGSTMKSDTASYYCVADNNVGTAQQCKATKMEVQLLLPCSAWSVLLQSCSGLLLTLMALPVLLGFNWL